MGTIAQAGDGTAADAPIRRASVLTFAPGGVLLVGDAASAAVFAVSTGDTVAKAAPAELKVAAINEQIADLLGIAPDELLVEDLSVNPISHRVYLSASRGRGPDAEAILLVVDTDGTLVDLDLAEVEVARAELPNAPADQPNSRRNARTESITDLLYLEGRVYVAGLSNEEFASNLRSLSFPFGEVDPGTSVEIFHAAHGQIETHSPVRTFAPFTIGDEPYLLAAYTCTPLVKFPVRALEPGAKIKGATIAELGNRNRPLDMVIYEKDGEQFLLMCNSSRGMMKLPLAGISDASTLEDPVGGGGTAGLAYETLEEWNGVVQMDRMDEGHIVVLVQRESGALDLLMLPLL